jgi:ABC-type transporter Mla subunit MlaD
MPRTKHSELTAGLFVVAGIVVLLGVVLWLGAADLLKPRGQLVSFYVPMSSGSVGIIEGAEVALGDGRIGRIVKIVPDPPNRRCLYRARLERSDVVVKRDANAVVVSPPVGQAKIVVTSVGSADQAADDANPVLLSGGLLQAMQHVDKLTENLAAASAKLRAQLDPNEASSLLAKIDAVIGEIRKAAGDVVATVGSLKAQADPDNPKGLVARFQRSAADINQATGSLAHQMDPDAKDTVASRIGRAAGNIEHATDPNAKGYLMAKVHSTVDGAQAIVKDAQPKIDRTLTAVAGAAEKIDAYTRKDMSDILAQLREANTRILKVVGDFAIVSEQAKEIISLNRDNVDETIDNLTQVSVNLKSAAKEIRRNPWRLLHEPDRKELRSQNLYDAVRAFSDGASQLDQAIARLRALQKIKSDDPELKQTAEKIHKRLEETFQSFTKAEEALWKELQK